MKVLPRPKFGQTLCHGLYIQCLLMRFFTGLTAPIFLIALCYLVANPFNIHLVQNAFLIKGMPPASLYILIFDQFEEPRK